MYPGDICPLMGDTGLCLDLFWIDTIDYPQNLIQYESPTDESVGFILGVRGPYRSATSFGSELPSG
jgi:hypothetical protein